MALCSITTLRTKKKLKKKKKKKKKKFSSSLAIPDHPPPIFDDHDHPVSSTKHSRVVDLQYRRPELTQSPSPFFNTHERPSTSVADAPFPYLRQRSISCGFSNGGLVVHRAFHCFLSMEADQELVQQTKGFYKIKVDEEGGGSRKRAVGGQPVQGNEQGPSSNHHETFVPNHNNSFHLPKLIHYKWWSRVVIYIVFLLAGQTTATLLGRLYFDKGGNSKWMSTLVQSAGFPILIPILLFCTKRSFRQTSSSPPIGIAKLTLLFTVFGLFLTGDNLMYSYGLLYLPVSTYSLLCATQLAFNAVTSYFINAQKFTMLVLNSLVLLTISACLLAINADDEGSTSTESRGKYIIGFLCTVGASAVYALFLSSTQFCFEKVFKNQTFSTVLNMQIYPSFVASCACVVGLFASGEWRGIHKEMEAYNMGRVSYLMTLIWIAISWQISSIGLLGLIFEVSSLFGNVISTLGLPLVPVFAVIFFHDKMSGVKVVALVLAIWGFMSYIYQHYLDDRKTIRNKTEDEVPSHSVELC
ncbi:hypothetical protein KSS87_003001 [Heliosperma pusillum]|nr:hypothetical protein KSS87_003001 [Heliosperma pusillum]